MKRFKDFITEARKLQWNRNPDIGWWKDQDILTLYHGTHEDNLSDILKNGLNKFHPNGHISLAFDPNTAHGYASMHGGETRFMAAGKKARHVPEEERVVLAFEIPMKWLEKNMDARLGGNTGNKKKLQDKSLYDDWKGEDQQYYQLLEIRVNKVIPTKFLKGYMKKK